MLSNKTVKYGAGAAAVVALAIGAGVMIGRHTTAAYAADEPISPQNIASEAGAPSVPGLCVLSRNAVYTNAKIGAAATARYRELTMQLRGQLVPQQQAMQDEARKLEAAKASMPAAEFTKKSEDLAARFKAFQASNGQDSRDLEFTREKALKQIATYADPVIADAYKEHHCGALFSRDAMLVGNPGMDLTPIVVAGLDSKVTTISFDLEKAPAPAAPAAAPAQAAP